MILLSVLVFIHELGHFAAAKLAGIRVDEFGIGFPPRAMRLFRREETEYTLNWLPIGGFVKLYGEEYEESVKGQVSNVKGKDDKEKAFYAQNGWVKSIVLTAGVLMNYLLGLVLIMVVFWSLGVPKVENVLEIQEVVPNSPAAQAGLKTGDVILRVAGQSIEDSEQVIQVINKHKGQEITFTFERREVEKPEQPNIDPIPGLDQQVTLIPREDPPEGQGAVGISFSVVPRVKYQKIAWWKVPGLAVEESMHLVGLMVTGIGQILRDLITQGIIPEDIAGPVGIAKITGQVAREGFYRLLQFAALLSINLAVINLLPFPALDGGRLVFVVAEAAVGRKLAPRVQRWANLIGMLALLGLMVLITVYDVVRIF